MGLVQRKEVASTKQGPNRCVQSFVSSITQKSTSLIPAEQLFEIAELAISMQEELEKVKLLLYVNTIKY